MVVPAPGLAPACRRGDARMVEVLLQHRAKSIAEFELKRTPLMEAACNGHAAVVALLLAAEGTDIQAADAHGNTALALAGIPQVRALLQRTSKQR
jgi:ankyrin repeat protein